MHKESERDRSVHAELEAQRSSWAAERVLLEEQLAGKVGENAKEKEAKECLRSKLRSL